MSVPPGGLDAKPFPAPRWILLVIATVLLGLAAWIAVAAALHGSLFAGLAVAAIFGAGGVWFAKSWAARERTDPDAVSQTERASLDGNGSGGTETPTSDRAVVDRDRDRS